jgi:hypothetical protein
MEYKGREAENGFAGWESEGELIVGRMRGQDKSD